MEAEQQPDTPAGGAERSFADRIKAIVADGKDVRAKIADAVREAAAMIHDTGETLGGISKSVIDEAVGAAAEEVGEPGSGSVLREVIDGVGDGFAAAAQAVDLAVAEARAQGRQFASEDLHTVAEEMGSAGRLLVETAAGAAKRVGGHMKDQMSGLASHAEHTAQRVGPSLESAASAVAGDLKGAVKQTAKVGITAARQGTGALFQVMGKLMQKTGEIVKVHRPESGPDTEKPAD